LAKGSKGSGTRVVFSNAMFPMRDGDVAFGRNSVGDKQKSNDQDLGEDSTRAGDPFLITSMIRRGARGNLDMSSGMRDASTG
jgi:hypothetical protein